MGVILKWNLVIRFLATAAFMVTMLIMWLVNPGDAHADAWIVAVILSAFLLFSNWTEMVETAAHMAHHMPSRGVNHEGNHESHTHSGR